MLDGESMRRIRILNNKTQYQVADALGVTRRYIVYVEHGDMNPSQEFYNDYLNYCYKGKISERAKQKKLEEKEKKLKEEAKKRTTKRAK